MTSIRVAKTLSNSFGLGPRNSFYFNQIHGTNGNAQLPSFSSLDCTNTLNARNWRIILGKVLHLVQIVRTLVIFGYAIICH